MSGCHAAPNFHGTAVPRATGAFGSELRWEADTIVLEPIEPPEEAGLSTEEFVTALRDEVSNWNSALAGCAMPRLQVADAATRGAARVDGRNVVTLRTGAWQPVDRRGEFAGYEPGVQATTQVHTAMNARAPHDGDVREADVVINAVDFRWSADGRTPNTRSLRAVLGHELGHVLGLDHVCVKPGEQTRSAKPECLGTLHAELASSVMYPDPTEAGRSLTLAPGDDVRATLCNAQSRSRP